MCGGRWQTGRAIGRRRAPQVDRVIGAELRPDAAVELSGSSPCDLARCGDHLFAPALPPQPTRQASPKRKPVSPGDVSTPGAPLISVLTPSTTRRWRCSRRPARSVRQQSFDDWELCLIDDGSTDPNVIAALRRHADGDQRIRLLRHDRVGGISAAMNAALGLARGEFVALLDHDDWLEPDALAIVARELAADPGLDMLYSDEDVVADGERIARHLKPDWSPGVAALDDVHLPSRRSTAHARARVGRRSCRVRRLAGL